MHLFRLVLLRAWAAGPYHLVELAVSIGFAGKIGSIKEKKAMRLCAKFLAVVLVAMFAASSAFAGFTDFVIRNGSSGSPVINESGGTYEFIISESGMKAGLGSNDINGATIGQISSLAITRHDDPSRFSAGSGPAVAPYFNIWVTDGLGNYAVLANEPSNGAFQPLFVDNGSTHSYNLSYADLSDKVVKVYETPGWNSNSSWVHALVGSGPLTFADVASLMIAPPPPSYITNGANAVGSGAPDDINTNVAYGFNWVFGDTLSNYVSGDPGYVVSGAGAAVVPVPAAAPIALLGMAIMGVYARRSRKQS